ncbi:protein phosphatase inhibitor, partial [Teladorsagia circumcincta]
ELVLRLSREPERPHVNWTTDTVDNENLGKKKSKCCCIYKKKKTWQDSSSSDESPYFERFLITFPNGDIYVQVIH